MTVGFGVLAVVAIAAFRAFVDRNRTAAPIGASGIATANVLPSVAVFAARPLRDFPLYASNLILGGLKLAREISHSLSPWYRAMW